MERGPPGEAQPPAPEPAWEEVSLADLVRTVYRRRALLVTFVLVGLLGAVAMTVLSEPAYEAQATIVPLEHKDIIENWLRSRQAAELALASAGPRLHPLLAPSEWDAAAGDWKGTPPTQEELATALAGSVRVSSSSRGSERLITLTASLPDPVAARDVARHYLATLDSLRPDLENITRTETFVKFYDGSNAQEAQRRSEEVARQKVYWLVLDTPLIPATAESPRPVLNVALGLALGLMLGVLAVFGAEWMGRFRAEFRGREELTTPAAPPPPAPAPATEPPRAAEPRAPEKPSFTVVRGGRPPPPKPDGNGTGAPVEPVARFWRRRN